ncbi:MAG: hypothetical protein ACREOP_08265 [Thermodesulfobacteriota bacterium]
MSEPTLVSENNVPNRKVVAGAITGGIVTVALLVTPFFGIQLPAEEMLTEKIEYIVGGVTALIFLVQYFTRPGKGDGTEIEKPKG